MSGKNWLERDPSQSPGLRRIQDAAQAAAVEKAREEQAKQWALGAENRARKEEQERLEINARIEQKTAQALPLLEEIRDFANKTKTYPLGPVQFEKYNEQEPSPFRGVPFRDPEHIFVCGLNDEIRFTQTVPQLVKEATIRISSYGGMYASDNGRILEVKYGFEGIEYDHSYIDEGFSTQCRLPRSTPVTICYGVRLRMAIAGTQIGDIELCQQREEEVTRRVNAEEAREARARGLTIEPHILLREEWVPFPAKPGEQKAMLAEAFHNPAYLGTTDKFAQPVEPQTNTGISGIVKGFLGLK